MQVSKRHIILLFLCGITMAVAAQSSLQKKSLITDALMLINTTPDESIKIGEHLLLNAGEDTEKIIPSLILSKSYLAKGDFEKVLQYAFDATNYSEKYTSEEEIEAFLIIYTVLRRLYIDGQAENYLTHLERIAGSNAYDSLWPKIMVTSLKTSIERQDYKEARGKIDSLAGDNLENVLKDRELKQQYHIFKGVLAVDSGLLEEAKVLLNKAKTFSENRQTTNYLERTMISYQLGELFASKKDHIKAIENFNESLEFAVKLQNLPFLTKNHEQLAINHLAIGDKTLYNQHHERFLLYSDQLYLAEQEAVNTAFNLINQEQDYKLESAKNQKTSYFYIGAAITLLLVFIVTILSLKSIWKLKRLKEIVSYLEASRNTVVGTKNATLAKSVPNKMLIPEETEKILIDKLKKFEKSTRFLSKDMSLAVLAGQFDTNTKYLSGIINSHYQDNFNTYINKLRINYIIEKLKTDPNYRHYKISYLAEVCGFSSHSAFGAVFKSLTRITPATFIDLLNSEIDEQIDLKQITSES